jgi:hypothetical protein
MNENYIESIESILENKIKNERWNEYPVCCTFDCEEDGSEMIVHKIVYSKDIWGDIRPMLTVQIREKELTLYGIYSVEHFIKTFGEDVLNIVIEEI